MTGSLSCLEKSRNKREQIKQKHNPLPPSLQPPPPPPSHLPPKKKKKTRTSTKDNKQNKKQTITTKSHLFKVGKNEDSRFSVLPDDQFLTQRYNRWKEKNYGLLVKTSIVKSRLPATAFFFLKTLCGLWMNVIFKSGFFTFHVWKQTIFSLED